MAIDDTPALSADELAKLRERWASGKRTREWGGWHVDALLATIAARDATVAAYREIVAAMADTDMIETYRRGLHVDDGYWDQLRSRARALLAGEAGDTTAAGEEGE